MRKILSLALLGLGVSMAMCAAIPRAPEIDAGSAGSALALLTGTVMVIRGRRRG